MIDEEYHDSNDGNDETDLMFENINEFFDFENKEVKPMLSNTSYNDDQYFNCCKTVCINFTYDPQRLVNVTDDDILELYTFVCIKQDEAAGVLSSISLDVPTFTPFADLNHSIELASKFTPMSSIIETTLYDNIKHHANVILDELLILIGIIYNIIAYRGIRLN